MTRLGALFRAIGVPILRSHLGEAIIHYPMGEASAAVEIEEAIVDWSDEGSQLGTDTVDQYRDSIPRRCQIDLPVSVNVSCSERPSDRDTFAITNPVSGEVELWHAIRVTGRDTAMQTIVCHRTESITTKRTRVKP